MINERKIKARMVEMGLTQKDLMGPDCLDCALSTVSQKLNGRRPLTLPQAERLGRKLELNDLEYFDFFFCRQDCVEQSAEADYV